MTEADLAAAVVFWLESDGWTVYQEVEHGVGRADIVAVRGSDLWVIEAKLALGLDVLAQARGWTSHAGLVSVAVAPAKSERSPARSFARELLRERGIGLLLVGPVSETAGALDVRVDVEAVQRQAIFAADLRAALRPEHQTHARAGTNRGGHWTAWKGVVAALRAHVVGSPGCTTRQAAEAISDVYRWRPHAHRNIERWIERGVVAGITGVILLGERSIRLFPTERTAP